METWLLLTLLTVYRKVASALFNGTNADQSPTTYHLATILQDWHTIMHYDPPRSFKVNNFYAI